MIILLEFASAVIVANREATTIVLAGTLSGNDTPCQPEAASGGAQAGRQRPRSFDPSYGSTVRVPHGPEEDRRVNSPSRGRSRDSQMIQEFFSKNSLGDRKS